MSMNVSLTPQLEEAVRKRVESGRYNSASEVVRHALRLLDERDNRLDLLRDEVMVGYEQSQRGEVEPLTDELIEGVKERGRARLASGTFTYTEKQLGKTDPKCETCDCKDACAIVVVDKCDGPY